MNPLSENVLITRVKNAVTAGTSDSDSSVLDMAGWDGVIYIALLNTVVDGSVLQLQAQGSAQSNGSSPSQEAATGSATAATNSNAFLVLDVIRPANRYQFVRVKRGTQNATIDGVIAIQYRGRNQPTSQVNALLSAIGVVNG